MRVADHKPFLFFKKSNMKYFANYEADAVVREDENGERYIKSIDSLREGHASKDNKEAWEIPSYGIYNFLSPITKEEYDNFGLTWDWSPTTGERRSLIKR